MGGESTRPGAEPVPVDEELRRVMPVIERWPRPEVPLSIDTSQGRRRARPRSAAGAVLVNDVTALRGDPDMAAVVGAAGAEVCLMHMQGEPRTMQDDPRYDDVVSEVKAFLEERLAFAVAEGIPRSGSGSTPASASARPSEHNLELLRRLDEIVAIGRPVVVGVSRKRFIGALTGGREAERLAASLAANVLAFERGAHMFRVHDVAETREALAVAAATVGGR